MIVYGGVHPKAGFRGWYISLDPFVQRVSGMELRGSKYLRLTHKGATPYDTYALAGKFRKGNPPGLQFFIREMSTKDVIKEFNFEEFSMTDEEWESLIMELVLGHKVRGT